MSILDTCSADSHCVLRKNNTVCVVDEGRCVGKNGAEQNFIVSIYHLFLYNLIMIIKYFYNRMQRQLAVSGW